MDAHLFRRFAQAAIPLLTGARLARIQEPSRDIYTFNLDLFSRTSSLGRKVQLVLKCGRKDPFLFLTTSRLSANQAPSAAVMRLRKYAGGHSIRHIVARWQERELWLLMSGSMPALVRDRDGTETAETKPVQEGFAAAGTRGAADTALPSGDEDTRLVWLVLRLKEGPQLVLAGPNEGPQPEDVVWPSLQELPEALENWRSWPVLSPALRRTIARLSLEDAAALLVDLETGTGDLFCYMKDSEREGEPPVMARISPWPLPGVTDLREEIREDILPAFMQAGADLVLQAAARQQAKRAAEPWIRKERKLEERLELQQDDVARLTRMCSRREQGLLLQANLWQLQGSQRCPSVQVLNAAGESVELRLDARYTIRENMERFFHTARRGERGLARVAERTRALEEELRAVRAQKEACLLGGPVPEPARSGQQPSQEPVPNLPATVQLFVSSDGFVLLRGRNARGNQDARRIASPHDIWVHAEGGPGSHVIIRRSHGAQSVPERTLDEAGCLAACRSWLRDEPSARLTYCEIRHVRPLRGAAPGTMRMDKVLFTRKVAVDSSLETRLARAAERS